MFAATGHVAALGVAEVVTLTRISQVATAAFIAALVTVITPPGAVRNAGLFTSAPPAGQFDWKFGVPATARPAGSVSVKASPACAGLPAPLVSVKTSVGRAADGERRRRERLGERGLHHGERLVGDAVQHPAIAVICAVPFT